MRSSLFPLYGIKFHLIIKLPQAVCGHNKKPIGMPDISLVTASRPVLVKVDDVVAEGQVVAIIKS